MKFVVPEELLERYFKQRLSSTHRPLNNDEYSSLLSLAFHLGAHIPNAVSLIVNEPALEATNCWVFHEILESKLHLSFSRETIRLLNHLLPKLTQRTFHRDDIDTIVSELVDMYKEDGETKKQLQTSCELLINLGSSQASELVIKCKI